MGFVYCLCICGIDDGNEEAEDGEEEEDLDFFVEQQPYIEDDILTLSGPKYGFANQRSGVLKKLQVRYLLLSKIKLLTPCATKPLLRLVLSSTTR